MRITNNVMVNNLMDNLQENMDNMDEISQKLSSGKDFQYPSEAPIRAAESMNFKSLISENEQFQKNIDQARNWLTSSENSLKDAGEILQRARELAIYGANDSLSEGDRQQIAEEVEQLKEEYINIANSQQGGRYLFAGQSTAEKPFDPENIPEDPENINDEDIFEGDNNNINREINRGIQLNINIDGQDAFEDGIKELNTLNNALENNNQEQLDNSISNLDQVLDNNIQHRAEIGAKINRLDLTESRLEEEQINLKGLQSENEDTDIAKAITDLKMQESVYRAALATGARMVQPNLVDFLR